MPMTLLPYGLKGTIYRSPMPFSRFDPAGDLLREYQECEVSAVVMLVGDAEALSCSGRDLRQAYEKAGMQVIQLDIRDFDVPDLEELRTKVKMVKELAESGRNLAIHCHAGVGRTGLFAACLKGEVNREPGAAGSTFTGDQAIDWVREYLPGAVESDAQRSLVNSYVQG